MTPLHGPGGSRRRVAIVGGGIAGLTLACALDPTRYEVVVHEAQPERVTGAALGLWTGARRALSDVGVDMPSAASDVRVSIHRLDGRHVGTVPSPLVAQVMRPQLMRALREAVPSTVRLVRVEVVDPSALDADLVVGADGVRSRVRGLVEPAAADRRATPWVTLRGVRWDADGVGSNGVAREFWGAGRLFGDAPVAGGRYWFTAHRADLGEEPLDVTRAVDDARAVFADAAPQVWTTLRHAGVDTLATRLWTTPPLHRYVRGRYVVIGDAAHAALPNLGRGASDAIVDAVTLGAALNVGNSLLRWEARRVPFTQAARWAASGVMRVATWGR